MYFSSLEPPESQWFSWTDWFILTLLLKPSINHKGVSYCCKGWFSFLSILAFKSLQKSINQSINQLQVEKVNYILFCGWLTLSTLQMPSLSITTSPQQGQREKVANDSRAKTTGRSLSYYHLEQKVIKLVKLIEFISNYNNRIIRNKEKSKTSSPYSSLPH